jgi:hypothetical protein
LPLIDELKKRLVALGVTAPIYAMLMPDNKGEDEAIALIDTGGFAPDGELPLRDPTVQVLTRAGPSDYPKAKQLAEQVFNLLHNKGRFQLGAAYVYECTAIQEPTPIGQDDKARWEITCNYHFKTRE